MKRVILLGETGFLGSRVARLLSHENNYRVISLYNNTQPTIKHEEFEYLNIVEYLNSDQTIEAEIIINLATKYNHNNNDVSDIIESNINMPFRILNKVRSNKELTFITADSFYSKFDFKKDTCIYTQSKCSLIDLLKSTGRNLRIVNARIEHMYGPNDSVYKFIPYILQKLKSDEDIFLTNCEHKRDFIYVEDVARAFIKLLGSKHINVGKIATVEIGTGKSISFRQMIEKAKKLSKSKSKLFFGSIPSEPNLIDDSTAFTSNLLTGWNTRTTLTNGLSKCLNQNQKKR